MSNLSDTEGGVMPGDDIREGGLRVGGKSEPNWRVMPAGDDAEGARSNNCYSLIVEFNDVLMGSAGRSLAGSARKESWRDAGRATMRKERGQTIATVGLIHKLNDVPALIQWHREAAALSWRGAEVGDAGRRCGRRSSNSY